MVEVLGNDCDEDATARAANRRIHRSTDRLIAEAADLLHVTKSAFVVDSARRAAEKVLARTDITLMAPEVFDAMMASLDRPDEAPELAELAALPRVIGR